MPERVRIAGKRTALISKKRDNKIIVQGAKKVNEFGCDDWFLFTWINGQLVSAEYLYTTCSCGSQSNAIRNKFGVLTIKVRGGFCDTGGGDGGSGDGNATPPQPPDSLAKDIIDSLKNPCLKAVLAALKNNDLKGKMSDIIHNVFGTSDKVNLFFDDDASTFTGEYAGKPAKTDPAFLDNGVYNETIHLNLGEIGEASQDFDAVIMMHEIIHGYMNYDKINRYNQLKQHQEMAEKYVEEMKNYLQSIYHTHDDAAYSMIMNGLGDIFKNDLPAYMNALKTKYGVPNPTLLYESHRVNLNNIGTGCPVPTH